MRFFRKKTSFILALTMLVVNNTFSYASTTNNSKIEVSQESTNENDKILDDIWSEYPNAWRIHFINSNNNMYYYRVYKERGSMNYSVIEYNNNLEDQLLKAKELIWIWAKQYRSEIRTIDFKTKKDFGVVYFKSGEYVNEKIIFIDALTKDELMHFVEK